MEKKGKLARKVTRSPVKVPKHKHMETWDILAITDAFLDQMLQSLRRTNVGSAHRTEVGTEGLISCRICCWQKSLYGLKVFLTGENKNENLELSANTVAFIMYKVYTVHLYLHELYLHGDAVVFQRSFVIWFILILIKFKNTDRILSIHCTTKYNLFTFLFIYSIWINSLPSLSSCWVWGLYRPVFIAMSKCR